jgi:hypothetical protein
VCFTTLLLFAAPAKCYVLLLLQMEAAAIRTHLLTFCLWSLQEPAVATNHLHTQQPRTSDRCCFLIRSSPCKSQVGI